MTLLRWMKAAALATVRHGRGTASSPGWMNLDNLLYMGLRASNGQRGGEQRLVPEQPSKVAAPYLFATVREHLFLAPVGVGFTGRRVPPWSGRGEKVAARFENAHLNDYFGESLLPSTSVTMLSLDVSPNTPTTHERRGGYFSVTENWKSHDIGTVSYTIGKADKFRLHWIRIDENAGWRWEPPP